MILRTACAGCLQTYELLIESGDIPLVKQVADGTTAPCPRLCGGRIPLLGDPALELVTQGLSLRSPMLLTGRELYLAVSGAGLPDEMPSDETTTLALLKTHKVIEADVEKVGKEVYLHELRLEGGICLHLSAGSRGARILKVTKEKTHGG